MKMLNRQGEPAGFFALHNEREASQGLKKRGEIKLLALFCGECQKSVDFGFFDSKIYTEGKITVLKTQKVY